MNAYTPGYRRFPGRSLMLATHRIRAWRLSLDSFSADELHRLSGVKLATVYTVLQRHAVDVEELPSTEAAAGARRRGGQVKRLRLSTAGRERLTREVGETVQLVSA